MEHLQGKDRTGEQLVDASKTEIVNGTSSLDKKMIIHTTHNKQAEEKETLIYTNIFIKNILI